VEQSAQKEICNFYLQSLLGKELPLEELLRETKLYNGAAVSIICLNFYDILRGMS
jgi:hypothetical protein